MLHKFITAILESVRGCKNVQKMNVRRCKNVLYDISHFVRRCRRVSSSVNRPLIVVIAVTLSLECSTVTVCRCAMCDVRRRSHGAAQPAV